MRFHPLLLAAALLGAVSCKEIVQPPVATKLAFVVQPVASIAAGGVITPAVTVAVQDADGNTVTSATNPINVFLTNPGLGGTLQGTTTVSAVNGIATFSSLVVAGIGAGYTLSAVTANLTGAVSTGFEVVPGPPNKLVFLDQPNTVTAGAVIGPVRVEVQDPLGNRSSALTSFVTMSLGSNPANGVLMGALANPASSGVALFNSLSIQKAGVYTLTATAVNVAAAQSSAFGVVAGPATHLVFTTQPGSGVLGGVILPALKVEVRDEFDNLVSSPAYNVTLALGFNPGSSTLAGTVTMATVSGVATFSNLSLNNEGVGYTLLATAPGLAGGTSAPFAMRTPRFLASVSAGYFHSCGLAANGSAYCWGDNVSGQLGAPVGTHVNLSALVSGGLTFATLTTGRTHTCGVTAAGVAYCWGDNALGTGAVATSTVPLAVSGGLSFASVLAGYSHTCGVTLGGAGYCWGNNGSGELGNGTLVSATVPGLVLGGLVFAKITPGRDFTCGLTVAGAAWCWGFNGEGYLGDGTTTSRLAPVPVSGGLVFAMVAAGGFQSCGLTLAGQAYCWGSNSFGQLGSGQGDGSTVPRLVAGGLSFASLSVGNRHVCGVTAAGVGYCWGENSNGMLGDGTFTSRSTPVPISGGLVFTAISAGRFHTCGAAAAGAVYCWGNGGLLGDGTPNPSSVPTRVF